MTCSDGIFGTHTLPGAIEQGVGGDQEGAPPVAREQSAEYSEDRSIGRPIANPDVELAFENTHLVTKHHDLDVLVRLRAPGQHDEAEDPTQADLAERESHAGSWPSPYEKCQSRGPIGILAPFRQLRVWGRLMRPGHGAIRSREVIMTLRDESANR